MKKKDKKLSLSKETLRSLEELRLEDAKGAATSAKSNCPLCTYTCP